MKSSIVSGFRGWLLVPAFGALMLTGAAIAQPEVHFLDPEEGIGAMSAEEGDAYIRKALESEIPMERLIDTDVPLPTEPPSYPLLPAEPPEVMPGAAPTMPLEPVFEPLTAPASSDDVDAATPSSEVMPSDYGVDNLNTPFHYTDHTLSNFPAIVPELKSVGKLLFTFDGESTYSCTAALIQKSILVTAGHCLHEGGSSGSYITGGTFMPGFFQGSMPFGRASIAAVTATTGWTTEGDLTKGYDVALAVLNKPEGQSVEYGDLVGYSSFCTANCLQNYWYLTQLGYPGNMFNGREMIMGQHLELYVPEMSMGYVHGSGMEGGSSGGPHIANWGQISDSSAPGQWTSRNSIFAVTSWGYRDETRKIQGSSPLTGAAGGSDTNNFKGMYNAICTASQDLHGSGSCTMLP